MIVAIDGPAGAGKSTVARRLAERLGFRYLETDIRVTSDGQRRHIGYYRDPAGNTRSAGTFTNQRTALRAGQRAEGKVEDGSWIDRQAGRVTFRAWSLTAQHACGCPPHPQLSRRVRRGLRREVC